MFRLSSGSHRSHKTMTPPHAVFPMVPRHGKHSPAQKSSLHLEKAVEGLATCSLNVSSLTVNYVHVAENILSFSRIKGYFWFNTFYFLCILNDCSMAFHVLMVTAFTQVHFFVSALLLSHIGTLSIPATLLGLVKSPFSIFLHLSLNVSPLSASLSLLVSNLNK